MTSSRGRRVGIAVGAAAVLLFAAGATPARAQADPPYCGPSLPNDSDFDLNGDGYDDAAVGDPYATVNGKAEAGSVTILFGTAAGIGQGARKIITQGDVGEVPEAGDHFGWDVDLARADTGETCAVLLIGAPGEDRNGNVDAGLVHLAGYLSTDIGDPPQFYGDLFTEAQAGGTVESGDLFGSVVVIVPTPGDEPRRYLIGAPGEDLGGVTDAGMIGLTDGTKGFLIYQGKLLPGGKVRVPGTPQAGDQFGRSIAVGSLDLGSGPGYGIVVGAPGDVVNGHDDAGSITALVQGEDWFDRAVLISQATAGVPGSAEAGDAFGYSVVLTRRAGENARVAVGAPAEDGGTIRDCGSVTVFLNRSGRLTATAAVSQDSPGFPGDNETGDRFGHALAFGHGGGTLWIGTPLEDLGSATDAGWVQPVQVSPTGAVTPRSAIAESTAGGRIATGNRFGNVLGALGGGSEQIMTASSIYAGTGQVFVRSDDGTYRRWAPSASATLFGWSVTN